MKVPPGGPLQPNVSNTRPSTIRRARCSLVGVERLNAAIPAGLPGRLSGADRLRPESNLHRLVDATAGK